MTTSFKIPGVSRGNLENPPLVSSARAMSHVLGSKEISWEASYEGMAYPCRGNNGFLGTALFAYANHHGLVINPDDIWVLILQGISKHVSENAEALRNFFVDFQGQEDIKVRRDGFALGDPNNDWAGVVNELASIVATRANHVNNLTCDFSTTTDLTRTIGNLTILDTLKNYFRYTVMTKCGVPEYVIEGTTQDWEKILSRTQFFLGEMGFTSWLSRIEPVLTEIIAASKGSPNIGFWTDFVKERSLGSGSPTISGHLLGLFPYAINYRKEMYEVGEKISSSDQVSSLTETPFIWNFMGNEISMGFVGGFVGFSNEKGNLRPQMAWGIRRMEKAEQKARPTAKYDAINDVARLSYKNLTGKDLF